ncbi:hypothetical protein JCM16161A_23880 [Vulcanisaeta sp. JCM 16161]
MMRVPTVTLSPENSLANDAMANEAGIATAVILNTSIDFIMKIPTGLIRHYNELIYFHNDAFRN